MKQINRRGLFGMLAGGSAVTAAKVRAHAEPPTALDLGPHYCECRWTMLNVVIKEPRGKGYMSCINPNCRNEGKRFKLPAVKLEEI